LLYFVLPRALGIVSSFIFVPVHAVQSWVWESSGAFPQFFRERSSLIDELNQYKYAQSASSGDKLTLELLSQENQTLRALLGAEDAQRIAAGVIGRPPYLPYDVLVLDRGSEQGVVVGAPVFIGGDAVIGVVMKVFPHASVVILSSTPGFEMSVYVVGPNIYTTAHGVGGGQVRIGVPQGIAIAPGNPVILPGIESGVYGEIEYVESDPSQSEQVAFVAPEVPLSSLRFVAIGTAPVVPITFAEASAIVEGYEKGILTVPIPDGLLVRASSTPTSTAATTSATSTP
jgi:cell shape-determining protein MreC